MAGVCVCIDDILVSGSSEEAYLQKLDEVLHRLNEVEICLKKEKCTFRMSEAEYLVHRITSQGLQPSQEKVGAIREAPTPKKVAELGGFLGLVNYYGKFLQNPSSKMNPLYKLLKKGAEQKWSSEQETAVKQVKKMFYSPKLLYHYDGRKLIQLSWDASPY